MVAVGRPASSLARIAAGCLAGAVLLLALASAPAQPAAFAPAPRTKQKPARSAPSKLTIKTPATAKPAPTSTPVPKAQKPAPTPGVEIAPKLTPLPPVDTSKPPPMLPRAAREKMRACAEEWDQMKRRTKVGELTWRAFATACLTR